MAKELSVLQQQAEAIKTEVNKGANTSSRIGGMFGDMLEYNEEQYEANKSNTGVSSYPKFSEGEVYTVGQVVNYGGKLYEFTTEHPEGSWNSAHVKSTSLKQIQDKKLTELEENIDIYNRIIEQGNIQGVGSEEGQISFYYSNSFFKKGDRGKLHFKATGTVRTVSTYLTTEKGTITGGFTTIIESNKQLSQDNDVIVSFVAKSDGYIMYNTSADTTVNVSCDIYESATSKIENLEDKIENLTSTMSLNSYSLTGKNEDGNPGGNKIAFNYTTLELKKGHSYLFSIKYTNKDEIGSLSFYTVNVQGTNSFGYKTIKIYTKTLLDEFAYTPEVDGYLMFNIGATINASVNVNISEEIDNSLINAIKLETGTLTGGNPDTSYQDDIIKFKYFEKKLFAGKTYKIRLVQNLIGNVINTEFKTISCYVVYTKGNTGGGYETVFESKKSFENNDFIEYTPKKDGYLMINTNATVNKTFYITIYDTKSIENRIDDLESKIDNLGTENTDNLTIKQKAKTVTNNSHGIFPIIKPQFKDVYLTLSGDSIFAFQSTSTKDDKGVAAVPPTCDKKANANMLWNALGWGNPQYRRFDYGKKSLVGDWDNTWNDDTNAFFIETGIFKTEYIGQERREDQNFSGQIGTNVMQVSTKIDEASFPYQFDNSEDSWWQRNIPKRFSNSENASVKFIIPAGYSKFDFLYHAHIHGDNNVTITIDRGDGVVKVNTVPNDFNGEDAVEANNHVCDLSMSSLNEPGGGNDTYGIPNMRLYFNILDPSKDTTITITKSYDTSKYLIYWGVTYWGTSNLPYALHINNMAIGGYTQQAIYNLRSAMFKFIPSDAIIMEMCYNNLANKTFQNQITSMNTYMDNLKTYFESIGKNIKTDIGIWLPHCGQQGYRDYPETVTCNYAGAEKLAIDKGYNVILNIYKICNDLHDTYYSDMSMSDFMNSLGNNGVHLGIQGQWIYSAAWESL